MFEVFDSSLCVILRKLAVGAGFVAGCPMATDHRTASAKPTRKGSPLPQRIARTDDFVVRGQRPARGVLLSQLRHLARCLLSTDNKPSSRSV